MQNETEIIESQRRPKINLKQNLVYSEVFIILYIQLKSKDGIILAPGGEVLAMNRRGTAGRGHHTPSN